jgi:hypothetical protein
MLEKDKHYTVRPVCKWCELVDIEKNHKPNHERWIFKGMANSSYPLLTTLERDVANIHGIDANNNKDGLRDLLEKGLLYPEFNKRKRIPITDLERGLIRRFKRQCHHYNEETPEEDNILEWLALMRHYGAPTRLLDWTYSFYVALFFALSDATPNPKEGCAVKCAVWALETKSITVKCKDKKADKKAFGLKDTKPKVFRELNKVKVFDKLCEDEHVTCQTWKEVFAASKPNTFVYPVNPFRLNERLVIQQGVFLCPGNIKKTFEDNLAEVLPEDKNKNRRKLIKYVIKCDDPKERRNILLNLQRMNINKATLFPGLGGFAESLKTLMVYPNLIKADSECPPERSTGKKK